MKSEYRLLTIVLLILFFTQGCHSPAASPPDMTGKINIGDYVFCIEEAVADQYNARIRCSLRRGDGAKIAPDARFESFEVNDNGSSSGGTVKYTLSDDGKIIWIDIAQSGSGRLDDVCTVTLRNLTFGEDGALKPVNGKWETSYRMQTEEETELSADDLKLQTADNSGSYQLSSVQISKVGVHMEMKIPQNDIVDFANQVEAHLFLNDGTVIELELHHSIRGKKAPFQATAEAVFGEPIKLDELYAIVVCGREIPIRLN